MADVIENLVGKSIKHSSTIDCFSQGQSAPPPPPLHNPSHWALEFTQLFFFMHMYQQCWRWCEAAGKNKDRSEEGSQLTPN